jgi:hypothetical protein
LPACATAVEPDARPLVVDNDLAAAPSDAGGLLSSLVRLSTAHPARLPAGVCVGAGLGLSATRLPAHPGLRVRLQRDLAALRGSPHWIEQDSMHGARLRLALCCQRLLAAPGGPRAVQQRTHTRSASAPMHPGRRRFMGPGSPQ